MTRCLGFVGLIFGHDYQPRYHTECREHHVAVPEPVLAQAVNTSELLADIMEATIMADVKRTYCGEVCVRCGDSFAANIAEPRL